MNLHRHLEPQPGMTRFLRPGDDGLRYLSFGFLCLTRGASEEASSQGEELLLVLLNGRCRVYVGSVEGELGPRTSVFADYAAAAYIPPRSDYRVVALVDSELALCGALSDAKTEPFFIRPERVGVRHVGRGNWSRTVTDILGPDAPAQRLLVGETYNPPGNWSSAPPHRHDHENPPLESDMEEVYFYRIRPPQGFGLQRLYELERGLDVVYPIRNNDLVSIPYGYHPVVAAPGYELYYLWALAGEKRHLIPLDDPEHAWIKGG